jgi:hypothetical protein
LSREVVAVVTAAAAEVVSRSKSNIGVLVVVVKRGTEETIRYYVLLARTIKQINSMEQINS